MNDAPYYVGWRKTFGFKAFQIFVLPALAIGMALEQNPSTQSLVTHGIFGVLISLLAWDLHRWPAVKGQDWQYCLAAGLQFGLWFALFLSIAIAADRSPEYRAVQFLIMVIVMTLSNAFTHKSDEDLPEPIPIRYRSALWLLGLSSLGFPVMLFLTQDIRIAYAAALFPALLTPLPTREKRNKTEQRIRSSIVVVSVITLLGIVLV